MNRVIINIYSMLIVLSLMVPVAVNAQVPGRISYQAVVRDNNNNLVNNRNVGIRISILQGSESGSVIYTETHSATTSANGLISLELGTGAGLGQIDWSQGPYFISTQTDPQGGSNYTITGVSRILAVPYALHAGTADRIAGFDLELIGNITPEDIARWNSMANALTETDPVFAAWDRSSGIVVTESQISDLKDYLTNISGESIGSLSDVDLTGLSPGKVLKYNADTGKWVIADDLGITVESDPVFGASPAKDITDAGSGLVITAAERTKLSGIEDGAAKTIFTVQEFTVADTPSPDYTLENIPRDDSMLLVSLNGMELRQTTEYTFAEQTKTLTIGVPLYEFDRITVSYTW